MIVASTYQDASDDHARCLPCRGCTTDAMAKLTMRTIPHAAYLKDDEDMSTTLLLQVLEHSPQRGSAKLLLLAIARFANADGTGATPSIATLARMIGTQARNVQYLLRELERSGELICEMHAGPQGCNRYTVVVPSSGAAATDVTDVHWAADPPVRESAPLAHSGAVPPDAADCAQLKERKTEGGRDAPPPADTWDRPVPTPPGERSLHADPWSLWQIGRAAVAPLDEAQLRTLAADLDGATGGYGRYWLGRAILAGSVCDARFATNPRALNLVRAILRRWQAEHAYGSDTRAYQSRLEHRDAHTRVPAQRLAAPRGGDGNQSHHRTAWPDAPARPGPRITACTIIGRDPGAD